MMFHSHSNKTYFTEEKLCAWPHFESEGFGTRKWSVKKLAGQGLLYIRIKQAYNFVLHESDAGQDQSGWLHQDN